MLTIHKLVTLAAVMSEGVRMHNALQCEGFTAPMLEQGTEIYSFRDENGESVANISVDDDVVTNIVGVANASVSATTLNEITDLVSFATIRPGHVYGGERMVGACRTQVELEDACDGDVKRFAPNEGLVH